MHFLLLSSLKRKEKTRKYAQILLRIVNQAKLQTNPLLAKASSDLQLAKIARLREWDATPLSKI